MNTRTRLLNFIALLGLATASTPLYSTTVEYSTRSAWQTAVSSITTTTFDTPVPSYYTPPAPGGNVSFGFGGVTLNGVTFQGYSDIGNEYSLSVVNAGPSSQYFNWGTGGAILRGDFYQGALARLHISLPNAVTAWGTDLMLGGNPGGNFTIKINGNAGCPSATCLAATATTQTPIFFGMTSDTAFTSIDLYVPFNSSYPALDNFSIAHAIGGGDPPQQPTGDTPEVATILLCASGLIGMSKAKKLRALRFA